MGGLGCFCYRTLYRENLTSNSCLKVLPLIALMCRGFSVHVTACATPSLFLFLHRHLMRIRYTFAAPRTAHTGSHLVDANVRHVSSQGASVFAAPFQCVWFMQLGTAGRAPLFHAAASWHPRDTRLRQGHQGTHGPASSAAAFLRCCGLHRAGGQLAFNQQRSVPPLHLRSCVLLQLPQLVKPAAKPHRPWRKKAQRERKRMRNDK